MKTFVLTVSRTFPKTHKRAGQQTWFVEKINEAGEVIFEYKLFQNGNAHVKMNQAFCKAFNLEVGKLKNWLHEPEDVAREFDVSMEDAVQMWNKGSLQLISKNSPLLIGFGG